MASEFYLKQRRDGVRRQAFIGAIDFQPDNFAVDCNDPRVNTVVSKMGTSALPRTPPIDPQTADSDEAARLKRDDCAQGFLDDAAPL
jgi:hypothetical protein